MLPLFLYFPQRLIILNGISVISGSYSGEEVDRTTSSAKSNQARGNGDRQKERTGARGKDYRRGAYCATDQKQSVLPIRRLVPSFSLIPIMPYNII